MIRLVKTSSGLPVSQGSSDPTHLIDNLTLVCLYDAFQSSLVNCLSFQEQKAAKDAVKLPFEHQGKPAEEELFLDSNPDDEGDDPDADLDI
jgi:hypothetical protein